MLPSISSPLSPSPSPSPQIYRRHVTKAPGRAAKTGKPLLNPSNAPFPSLSLLQAAAEQPLPSDDVLAARITQLFYDLDVDMIKTTLAMSGCCCVAAAFATPLMIVVSCGDCRFVAASLPTCERAARIQCSKHALK